MNSLPITTVLLFVAPFAAALGTVLWLLQRGGPRASRRPKRGPEQRRIAHLLQDDIGQKIAAARVNLSALRMHLRTGGVPESAELDAAMTLLDDGCRDIRTVSRLMAKAEPESPPVGAAEARD